MARDDDHSIYDEPHMQGRSEIDPSEQKAADRLAREKPDHHQHSVFDEPDIIARAPERIEADWTCRSCGYNLRGTVTGQPCPECGEIELYRPAPADAASYGSWLDERVAATSAEKTWWVTVALILISGPWAILTSLMGGEPAGTVGIPLMLVVVFGPTTEELMKIGAALVLVETRPYLFKNRAQLQLAVLAGAVGFAAIENLIYLNLYIPNPSMLVTVWRWTVCVALHTGCTLIASRGLVRMWEKTMTERRPPQIQWAVPTILAAIVTHGLYNLSVTILQMAGFFY